MPVKTQRSVPVPVLVDLSECLQEGRLAAFDIGPDGSVWCLAQHGSTELYEERSGGLFPKARTNEAVPYSVWASAPGGAPMKRVLSVSTPVNLHHVQPLGPDYVLLAGARCRRFADGTVDRNGQLYSLADGTRPLRELVLGDGIEHLQTTSDLRIWAGYFDEGVFGNYGWGGSGPEPIGASGLVCFDAYGNRLRAYDAEAAGTDAICDCYALNVASDDDVWLCFYTDFPLVRLRRGEEPGVWPQELSAPKAVAITDGWALFAGGYKADEPCTLVLLESHPRRVRGRARLHFTRPDGTPWRPLRYAARGPFLYGLAGSEVFRVDVRELAYW